jgi:hypothetical protein
MSWHFLAISSPGLTFLILYGVVALTRPPEQAPRNYEC